MCEWYKKACGCACISECVWACVHACVLHPHSTLKSHWFSFPAMLNTLSLSGQSRPASGSPCYDRGYNNRRAIPLLSAAFRRGNLPQAQINNTHTHALYRTYTHTYIPALLNRLQPPKQNIFQKFGLLINEVMTRRKKKFRMGEGGVNK